MAANFLRNRWIPALSAALLTGLATGSWATVKAGLAPFGKAEAVEFRLSAEADTPAEASRDVSFANGFAPVVRKVLPAVVNITSSKIVPSPLSSFSPSDPFLQDFFDDERARSFFSPRREQSVGSGVIVSADGYIITNDHVVSGAVEIKATLADKRELTARLVGSDPRTDIAILKVDERGLPAVSLGDSSQIRVGDFTIAVGNSFGVGQAVTVGIISATGRGGFRGESDEDFIQTDAAINPGNSGGALADINGNLIGINTAILSATSGNQGVGFAIPVNMARHVMDEILKKGAVTRGWLGVTTQSLDTSMAKAFGLSGFPRGALVNDVAADSPAATSGIAKGDIILEIDGEPLADSRALGLKISSLAPGAVVKLKLTRKGKEREISVTLTESPSRPAPAEPAPREREISPRLGLTVQPLTPNRARQLGVTAIVNGIVIDDVRPGSPADEADLHRGDVIEEINHNSVSKVEEFQDAVHEDQRQPILLLIARGRIRMFVVVDPRV